ncbi:MAG: hypothetical protein ACRDDX_00500 [Cellulosilyticaceae bacterium]
MNASSYSYLQPTSSLVLMPPKTEIISGITTLSSTTPPIHHLIDFTIEPEITRIKPLHTTSESAAFPLSQLSIDLNLVETLSYINRTSPFSIQQYIVSYPKRLYINLPPSVEGIATYELLNSHTLCILPSIHTVYSTLLDAHNLYKRALLSFTFKKVQ